MRGQWGLITGIVVVLIIAIFAVINVDPVEVNYLFGQSEWPLVLVILGSVLMGGLIVGGVGMYRIYQLQSEIKKLKEKVSNSNQADLEIEEINTSADQANVSRKDRKK